MILIQLLNIKIARNLSDPSQNILISIMDILRCWGGGGGKLVKMEASLILQMFNFKNKIMNLYNRRPLDYHRFIK